MKGITKAIKRTPHLMTSKIGMATKSTDPEYDGLSRRFTSIEQNAEKLLKDSSVFRDGVKNMLMSGANFGAIFATLFSSISSSELDLERKHPSSVDTIRYISAYQTHMEDLRETLVPEIELIESRIIAPAHEFITICKAVRKNIVKRDHKLIDYDRTNNAFTKAKDKKEKTLKDEQNLFKLEQEFEAAVADYEYYNNAMKEQLPIFFEMATRFITPLFHSFYYMQLNVFYLSLDKLQNFASGKFDLSSTASVEDVYAQQLTDAAERLDALSIRKGPQASARVLAANRTPSMSKAGLGSSASGASGGGLASGAPSKTGLPPTRSNSSTVPPPYSVGAGSTAAAGKRPPPPIPAKKPGVAPKQYVVALYDYAATAAGDLSFSAGDRIEVVERTASTEDWWTGVVNGQKGVFPGNYVRDE